MSNLDLDKIIRDLGRAKDEVLSSHKMPTPSGCPEGEVKVKRPTWGDSLLSSMGSEEMPYDLTDAVEHRKEIKTLEGQCSISEVQYLELLRSEGSMEAVKEFALRQALLKLVETADITGLTD